MWRLTGPEPNGIGSDADDDRPRRVEARLETVGAQSERSAFERRVEQVHRRRSDERRHESIGRTSVHSFWCPFLLHGAPIEHDDVIGQDIARFDRADVDDRPEPRTGLQFVAQRSRKRVRLLNGASNRKYSGSESRLPTSPRWRCPP